MIKVSTPFSALLHLASAAGLLLLTACAPTVAGPSTALKQQFAQLQQQQNQQAELLAALQQQLNQIQWSGTLPTVEVQPQPAPQEAEMPALKPAVTSAVVSQELVVVADSALSYLEAFSNLAAGRNTAAEAGFTRFLQSYPQHQYSANARYRLASAQTAQGKLPLAASNLRQIIIA